MGPKYEFTGETKKQYDYTLHRIRRLSDGKIGGWIESEENLSQEGDCWVDGDAEVYNEAKVYGNAKVYDNATITERSEVYEDAKVYGNAWISRAKIFGNAKVYGDAQVYNWSEVYGNAKVYGHIKAYFCDICDNAQVFDNAEVCGHIYGNAQVYGNTQIHGHTEGAQIYDNAKVYGNAQVYNKVKVHGDALVHDIEISSGEYTSGEFSCNADLPKTDESNKVIQDFIYKIDDSNKLKVKTEYSSIDEYFNSSYQNDTKLDTLIIGTIDTKIPLIKLEKIEKDEQLKYKFIVDLTTENEDHFLIQSFIETKEQLSQKLTQTIDALNQYLEFNKYTDDLSNCICD